MSQMHACHLSAPILGTPETAHPAAPRRSLMTARAAQWMGLVMLCEVYGLIILLSLR